MSSRIPRIAFAPALVAVFAVIGAVIGAVVTQLVLFQTAASRADTSAQQRLERIEDVTRESNHALARANASGLPFCSEAELALLREVLFESRYLKDIGRLRDGRLHCSAILGTLAEPFQNAQPDFVSILGRRFHLAADLVAAAATDAVVIEDRQSNVVISPFAFEGPGVEGATLGAFMRNQAGEFVPFPTGGTVDIDPSGLLAGEPTQRGGDVVALACSGGSAACVVARIGLWDLWRSELLTALSLVGMGSLGAGSSAFAGVMIGRRRRSMDYRLRKALREDALRVAYQPMVDLKTGRVVGAEALVRWADAGGAPVRPDVFIPIAEAEGYIGAITRFVVEGCAEELGKVLREDPEFYVGVNIDISDLLDPMFPVFLCRVVDRHGIRAGQLALELTERRTSETANVQVAVAHLRRLGFRVFIDDFGTGYSSLAYLQSLHVDAVKIDRAFTSTIGTEAVTVSVVPHILEMAKTLGLSVVAEGVETEEQARYLRSQRTGVRAQGWYFGPPEPAVELQRRLAAAGPPRPSASRRATPPSHAATEPARGRAAPTRSYASTTRSR